MTDRRGASTAGRGRAPQRAWAARSSQSSGGHAGSAAMRVVPWRCAIAAALAPLLLATAPGHGAAQPVRSLLEMRQERVVVQEWDLSCGAAALATVLNYQHDDAVSCNKFSVNIL